MKRLVFIILSLVAPVIAWGATPVAGSCGTAGNQTGTAYLAPGLPTYTAGDLLIAFMARRDGTGTFSCATNCTGWTKKVDLIQGSYTHMAYWWKISGASESAPTFTGVTGPAVSRICAIGPGAGGQFNATTPFDANTPTSLSSASASPISVAAFTIVADNTLPLAFVAEGFANNGTATVSHSSGPTASNLFAVSQSNASTTSRIWHKVFYGAAHASGSSGAESITESGATVSSTYPIAGLQIGIKPTDTILVTSVSVNPTSATITGGNTQNISATANPSNVADRTVNWTKVSGCDASDSISPSSSAGDGSAYTTLTTSSGGSFPRTCVIRATANDGSGYYADSSITITSSIAVTGVTINPTSSTITSNQSVAFTATVSPSNATGGINVNWSVTGTNCTSDFFDASTSAGDGSTVNNYYINTGSNTFPRTCTVTATSVADGTKSASSSITINAQATYVNMGSATYTGAIGGSIFISATSGPSFISPRTVNWSKQSGCDANDSIPATSDGTGTNITFTAYRGGTVGRACVLRATATDGSGAYAETTITVAVGPLQIASYNATTTATSGTTLASSSFSAPTNSMVAVGVVWDSDPQEIGPVTITGASLSWSKRVGQECWTLGETNRINAEIWTAYAPAGFSAQAITATWTSDVGGYTNRRSLHIKVFQGADPNVGAASDLCAASSNAVATPITPTQTGSYLFMVGVDDSNASPTLSGTITSDYAPGNGEIFGHNSATAVAGVPTTLGASSPNSSFGSAAALEIRALPTYGLNLVELYSVDKAPSASATTQTITLPSVPAGATVVVFTHGSAASTMALTSSNMLWAQRVADGTNGNWQFTGYAKTTLTNETVTATGNSAGWYTLNATVYINADPANFANSGYTSNATITSETLTQTLTGPGSFLLDQFTLYNLMTVAPSTGPDAGPRIGGLPEGNQGNTYYDTRSPHAGTGSQSVSLAWNATDTSRHNWIEVSGLDPTSPIIENLYCNATSATGSTIAVNAASSSTANLAVAVVTGVVTGADTPYATSNISHSISGLDSFTSKASVVINNNQRVEIFTAPITGSFTSAAVTWNIGTVTATQRRDICVYVLQNADTANLSNNFQSGAITVPEATITAPKPGSLLVMGASNGNPGTDNYGNGADTNTAIADYYYQSGATVNYQGFTFARSTSNVTFGFQTPTGTSGNLRSVGLEIRGNNCNAGICLDTTAHTNNYTFPQSMVIDQTVTTGTGSNTAPVSTTFGTSGATTIVVAATALYTTNASRPTLTNNKSLICTLQNESTSNTQSMWSGIWTCPSASSLSGATFTLTIAAGNYIDELLTVYALKNVAASNFVGASGALSDTATANAQESVSITPTYTNSWLFFAGNMATDSFTVDHQIHPLNTMNGYGINSWDAKFWADANNQSGGIGRMVAHDTTAVKLGAEEQVGASSMYRDAAALEIIAAPAIVAGPLNSGMMGFWGMLTPPIMGNELWQPPQL